MDDDEPQKTYPLSPPKMSMIPSWVMLGFFFGAAFVWAYKSETAKPAPKVAAPATPMEWPKSVKLPPSPLTTIEAVFAIWGKYAVWEDDVAEVALWRSETKSFSEFYEIRRIRDVFYFRSIPKLTRLIIRHGKPLPSSPLQFTETEEQYRDWLENGRQERPDERTLPVSPLVTPPIIVTPPLIDIGAVPTSPRDPPRP